MKSILKMYKSIHGDQKNIYSELSEFETEHYKLVNENRENIEQIDQLKFDLLNAITELDQIKTNDQNVLTDISKKLSSTLKIDGEDDLMTQFVFERSKIMDHFTMAYIAELKLKPSQVKLVQGVNEDGLIEMYFEKHSNLILPDNLK